MTEQSRITLGGDALAEHISHGQNRENKRDVFTRSQAKLWEAKKKLDSTRTEMIDISKELEKNERGLQALQNLVNSQRKNLADLTADYRSDLQLTHQLEMDGVFIPPDDEEEEKSDGEH